MKPFLQVSVPLLALSACSPAVKETATARQAKPNIIFIIADDLGYNDLSCYGQKNFKTPSIDKIASEGMRFTQHYSGTTVSAPSRCSLMTGMHTGHCYIRGNRSPGPMGQEPIKDSVVTVAELLKQAGYYTGMTGKWGLGGPDNVGEPNNQGIDYFYGYLCQGHAHNYYPEFLFRNKDRVPLRNVLSEPKNPNGTGVAIVKVDYSSDLIDNEAIKFVTDHKDTTFALFMTVTIPHANDEGKNDGMEVPDYSQFDNQPWPKVEKQKAAMITRLDSDIGRLMEKLKELGLDEKTIVIFTSDNGPHKEGGVNPEILDSNGQLRGTKRDLYEGGIRIPFIARWPGKIKAGSVSNHVSAFWDFLPTVCEITGLAVPSYTDGISYLPELLGKPQKKHEYFYWEFSEQGGKQAVLLRNWKGVRNNLTKDPKGPIELYDLSKDISETNNIAAQNKAIVDTLALLMEKAHVRSVLFPLPGEPGWNSRQ